MPYLVGEDEFTVDVFEVDRRGRIIADGAQQFLAFAQGALGALSFGYILDQPNAKLELAVPVMNDGRDHAGRKRLSVFVQILFFEFSNIRFPADQIVE